MYLGTELMFEITVHYRVTDPKMQASADVDADNMDYQKFTSADANSMNIYVTIHQIIYIFQCINNWKSQQ